MADCLLHLAVFSFFLCTSFRLFFLDSISRFISLPLVHVSQHPPLVFLLLSLPSPPFFNAPPSFLSVLPPRWQRLSWPPLTRKQARLSWQPPVVHMMWCTFIFRCLPFKTIRNGLTGALVPEWQIFRDPWLSDVPQRNRTDVSAERGSVHETVVNYECREIFTMHYLYRSMEANTLTNKPNTLIFFIHCDETVEELDIVGAFQCIDVTLLPDEF